MKNKDMGRSNDQRNSNGRNWRLVLIIVVFISAAFPALSTDSTTENQHNEVALNDRILHGHKFLRPYRFPLAIPTTNVGVGLGYFYTTLDLEVDEDLIYVEQDRFRFGGLNEVMTFEIEFIDRLSIEFQVVGRAAVGADRDSALLFGGRFTFSASVNPKITIIQRDNWGTAISFALGAIYDAGAETSPIALLLQVMDNTENYIQKLLKSGEQPELEDAEKVVRIRFNDAITEISVFSLRPTILWAQTIHPSFGVQMGLRLDQNIIRNIQSPDIFGFDDTDPDTTLLIGTSFSFDLGELTPVSMGFRLLADYEHKWDNEFDFDNWITGIGISYTGRSNLELGLIYFGRSFSTRLLKASDQFLVLNIRYYW